MRAAPSVYAAINAVSVDLAAKGVPKGNLNEIDNYRYRSIDDLLDRLAPLLAKHRLCILPRVLERVTFERWEQNGHLTLHVSLRVAFDLTSVDDGSMHAIEAYGEALDASDKATAKAMSAAYKSGIIQTFCIPLAGSEDADREAPRISARTHDPEPVQGWEQWCRDIEDVVCVCESVAAIELLQSRNRELLKSLGRERPDLYAEVGNSIGSRREALAARTGKTEKEARARSKKPKGPLDRRELASA